MSDSDSLDQQESEKLKELEKELDEIGMKASEEIGEETLEKNSVGSGNKENFEKQQDDKLTKDESSQVNTMGDYDSVVSGATSTTNDLDDSQLAAEVSKEFSPTSESEEPRENELAPKANGESSRSILRYGLALMMVAIITLGGYFVFSMNKKGESSTFSPTPSAREMGPTEVLTPTEVEEKEGFGSIYNPDAKRYILDFPEECIQTYPFRDEVKITCTLEEFVLKINPQAGGHGAVIIETTNVEIAGYSWERRDFYSSENKETRGTTWSMSDQETDFHYLIEVHYDPFSEEARDYFEDILSTFQYVEDGENPTVTPVSTQSVSPSPTSTVLE